MRIFILILLFSFSVFAEPDYQGKVIRIADGDTITILKDKEQNEQFDFVFQNAFGLPVIFTVAPTKAGMKANSWGKVKDDDTAIYMKFGDGGAVKITATALA